MDQEAINLAVKAGVEAGVKAALEDKLKPLYIDRETHYKQHEFIGNMMKWADQCKSAFLKSMITILVGGAIALIAIGAAVKYSGGGKP